MAKKAQFKILSSVNNYDDYKIHKNLILYLQKKWKFYPGKKFKKKKNILKTIIL